jgi:hypothetical protein
LVVALGRGREVANIYSVAPSEMLDPDLVPVPARREISDELRDSRAAIKREGSDYAAAEVRLRKVIAGKAGPHFPTITFEV